MPDPSVYQRFQVAGPPRPISEAPDTGTYETETSTQSANPVSAVEMPAEVPAKFSHLSAVDADEKHRETDEVDGLNATRELPA